MAQMKSHWRQAAGTRVDLFIGQSAAPPASDLLPPALERAARRVAPPEFPVSVPRNHGSGNSVQDHRSTSSLVSLSAPNRWPLPRLSVAQLTAFRGELADASLPTVGAVQELQCCALVVRKKAGPVAQLDRALRFERRGWEFKSLRVHHCSLSMSRELSCLKFFRATNFAQVRNFKSNMPRFDVTIAGELNLDLILYGLPDELPPERELLADRMMLTLGSSSAIVAHNLAALGSRVGFQSLIGDDSAGTDCARSSGRKAAWMSLACGESTAQPQPGSPSFCSVLAGGTS